MTIFSKIIAGQIPCYKIAESDKFFAFLDIYPVQKGHTLVIPKIEVDKIFDVPDEYLAELLVFAKPIARAIESSFNCNRVNILTVGLEVPHAHVHLIPINQTNDMNLLNKKLKLSAEEMQEIQEKIVRKLTA
jgi:histidine triad (HIT) family protein